MAARLNLLPKELTPSETVTKTGKLLNNIAIGVTGLFIILAIAGGVTLFLLNNRKNELVEEQNELRSNIVSLQNTEAQLILLKDRLEKVDTILARRDNEDAFEKQRGIIDSLPDDMALIETNIQSGQSNLELSSNTSRSIANLIGIILTRNEYSDIVMEELRFNQFTGYNIIFEVF